MALTAVAGALLGTGINAGAGIGNEMLQRHWQLKDYNTQQRDALRAWDRENAYNSPEQQMARLAQAGLNPNLVYGKGADNTASSIKTPSMGEHPKSVIPNIDPLMFVKAQEMGTNLKAIQAQTDNTIQDTENKKTAQQLETLKILNQNITNSRDELQLRQNQDLYDDYVRRYKLENQAIEQNMSLRLEENDRAKLASSDNHEKVWQDIFESRKRELVHQSTIATNDKQRELIKKQMQQIDAGIELTKSQKDLNEAELKLRKEGISYSDPYYLRLLIMAGKHPDADLKEIKRELDRRANLENEGGADLNTGIDWMDEYLNKPIGDK
jgi:hypothetical protein